MQVDPQALVREVLGVVLPPESCPFDFIDLNEEGPLRDEFHKARRENRRWRWKIALVVLGLIGFSGWIFFISGYTRASDVDTQINKALAPIDTRVQELSDRVAKSVQGNALLATAIYDQLAAHEADDICRLLLKRKVEKDPLEKERLRGQVDAAQERYKGYKQNFYAEERCLE